MSKTYSELMTIPTYEERVRYLETNGSVAEQTFGGHRVLNQIFYSSPEWKAIRKAVIIRDNGCDLAIPDKEIFGGICVHHIEPITIDDVLNRTPKLLDPENLITVSIATHKAIHYGGVQNLPKDYVERTPNDTKLW